MDGWTRLRVLLFYHFYTISLSSNYPPFQVQGTQQLVLYDVSCSLTCKVFQRYYLSVWAHKLFLNFACKQSLDSIFIVLAHLSIKSSPQHSPVDSECATLSVALIGCNADQLHAEAVWEQFSDPICLDVGLICQASQCVS